MGRAGRVRVAGPLAAFADGFGAELKQLGYSRFTVEAQLQLMAHVGGWLGDRGLGTQQLTAARVEEYLVYRRACGCSPVLAARARAAAGVSAWAGGRAARDGAAGADGGRSVAGRV
jgi:integrase/recombinase XerD